MNYKQADYKILQDFFEIKNFSFKEKSLEDKNIRIFKVFYNKNRSYEKNKSYKIGGILKYNPKSLAYIFINLDEEIKGYRDEN